MKSVPIHTEYITLGQFLKLINCIQTGGQAKFFLQEHPVQVNGQLETRRGRKLYARDTIIVEGFGEYIITGPT